jgi:hypothetical protein
MTIPLVIGVNPLQTTLLQLGIVSGRVALLPRSTEIHPVLLRFVSPFLGIDSREGAPAPHPCSSQLLRCKTVQGAFGRGQGNAMFGLTWSLKGKRQPVRPWCGGNEWSQ